MSPRRAASLWPSRNAVLVGLLGLGLGLQYFLAIDLQAPGYSLDQQQHVISGEAGSPYRYRVLVPFLLEGGTRLFSLLEPQETAFLHATAIYDCLGLVGQLLALYGLLRQWFSPVQALVGVAFTSGVTLATFAYFTYQPWSILEVLFFSLGLLLAYRGHWTLVGLVVVLAALNRETGVFLPLALLLGSLPTPLRLDRSTIAAAWRRPETRLTFAFTVASTAVFMGLRLVRGGAPPVDELGDVIARNLQRNNLIAAGLSVPLFFGIGWLYAVLGLPRTPRFIRQVARVLPFYLGAFAIWGWWREVRILTSLYPIVIPMVLAYLYLPRATMRPPVVDQGAPTGARVGRVQGGDARG